MVIIFTISLNRFKNAFCFLNLFFKLGTVALNLLLLNRL